MKFLPLNFVIQIGCKNSRSSFLHSYQTFRSTTTTRKFIPPLLGSDWQIRTAGFANPAGATRHINLDGTIDRKNPAGVQK